MTWGKSLLLTIPLMLSGMFVVPSPASAQEFADTDWKTVSAGGSHACGTDSSNYLYCWGNDDHGQLGNTATFNSKTTPNRVGDGSGWTVVSAGGAHTCAIRSGKLYCWGSDGDGQLGNASSTTEDKGLPQRIGALSDWKTVSAGGAHTCAIRGAGNYLYCWGDDSSGQSGDASTNRSDKPYPKVVAGPYTGWKAVSAGTTHTCGIRTSGYLYCWGDDSRGQLGNASVGSKHYPYRVGKAIGWTQISAGGAHSCATRTVGYLYCWGDDGRGQLGNGSVGSKTYPYQVGTAKGWTQISAGGAHSCGMRTSRLYCWGDNEYGQSMASSEDPAFVTIQAYPDSWKAQDTGQRHTCATKGDGTLNCWGVPEPPPPDDCPTDRPANVYANDPWQDLRYWKLTTPVDGSDSGGTADEVKQPALKTLDGEDYFDRLSNPTRLLFRARVDGATTSGSSFPRSELREMTQDGQYNRAAWSSKCGVHTMTIEQAITHQPERDNGDDPVVAGQIHDGGVDGGQGDVIMVRLEGSRLFVEGDGHDYGTLDSSYGLSEKFTVVITADRDGIDVN